MLEKVEHASSREHGDAAEDGFGGLATRPLKGSILSYHREHGEQSHRGE